MWRLVSLVSLLLTLGFGAPAEAKCAVCVESIRAESTGGAPNGGSTVTLKLTARSHDSSALPPTGLAVVMVTAGQPTGKCLNVSLRKIDEVGGLGTYIGTFTGFYTSGATGPSSYTGRIDIGGNIHDFSVPLSGAPGTVTLVDVATPAPTAVAATAAPAAPAAQQAPQTQLAPARAESPTLDLGALAQRPLVMIGLALAAIALMVYGGRRSNLGRASG